MKRGILLHLLLFLASLINAQSGGVKFYAQAEPSDARMGESIKLTFTLTNATGSDFIPPELSNFNIISGPNRSVSVQSINGKWKQVTEYSFILMPKYKGVFTVNPATIIVRKGTIETEPIVISVLDLPAPAVKHSGKRKVRGDSGKEIFVDVVPEKSEAFVGEQVAVDFVFYTSVSVQDFRIVAEPGFGGAYAQELKFYDEPQSQVEINGNNFIRKLIKRYVVFPQESGKIDIQPMTLEVNAFTEDGDPFSSFFGRETETKYFTTDQLSLKVNPLPGNAGASFLGAVGNWRVDLYPVSTHISKNDALNFMLTVQGDGDIKNVQVPELHLSDDFEMYSPKTVEENSTEKNGRLISKKVFEIMMIPRAEGKFELSTEFSWFDTSKKAFETRKFGPFSIIVDKAMHHEKAEEDEAKDDTSSSLVPAMKKYLAIAAGIVILGTLIWSVFFIRSKKNKTKQKSELNTIQAVAVPEVQIAVADPAKGLEVFINNADQQQFYSHLRKNLSNFLIQKLSIDNKAASTTEIISRLQSAGTDAGLVSMIKTIFTNCEQALYAGADKSAVMQMMVSYLEEIKARF